MSSGQKGIMLCERPGPDAGPGQKPFLPSSLPSGLEPPGLVPTQKTFPPSLAPKPENINLKTIAAVRELEHENKLAALREEERRMAEEAKAESINAFGSQLRAAILAGEDVSFWRAAKKADAARQSVEASKTRAAAAAASTSTGGTADGVAAGAAKADMATFVDALVKEATGVLGKASEAPAPAAATAAAGVAAAAQRSDGTAEASTSGGGGAAAASGGTPRAGSAGSKKGRGGASKPAWALTAEEVARLDDAEEEELLRFAEELDFDSFMSALDDVELQESVKALGGGEGGDGKGPGAPEEKAAALRRNLVRAMNHAAMKRVAAAAAGRRAKGADDGDAASVAMASEGGASRATAASRLKSEAAAAKRSALGEGGSGGGGGGWEGSTRGADDVARMDRAKAATQEAFEFLRENPELRSVHSPASVRALIGKTEAAS